MVTVHHNHQTLKPEHVVLIDDGNDDDSMDDGDVAMINTSWHWLLFPHMPQNIGF